MFFHHFSITIPKHKENNYRWRFDDDDNVDDEEDDDDDALVLLGEIGLGPNNTILHISTQK